jgi:hypothetical protein
MHMRYTGWLCPYDAVDRRRHVLVQLVRLHLWLVTWCDGLRGELGLGISPAARWGVSYGVYQYSLTADSAGAQHL